MKPSFIYRGRGTNASSLQGGILTQRRSVTIHHEPNEQKCMSFITEAVQKPKLYKGKRSHVCSGRISVVNFDNDQLSLTPELESRHLPLKIDRPTESNINVQKRKFLTRNKRLHNTFYYFEDTRHTFSRVPEANVFERDPTPPFRSWMRLCVHRDENSLATLIDI